MSKVGDGVLKYLAIAYGALALGSAWMGVVALIVGAPPWKAAAGLGIAVAMVVLPFVVAWRFKAREDRKMVPGRLVLERPKAAAPAPPRPPALPRPKAPSPARDVPESAETCEQLRDLLAQNLVAKKIPLEKCMEGLDLLSADLRRAGETLADGNLVAAELARNEVTRIDFIELSGDRARADTERLEAWSRVKESDHPALVAHRALACARVKRRADDRPALLELLERATTSFKKAGCGPDLRLALYELAELLFEKGDLDGAERRLNEGLTVGLGATQETREAALMMAEQLGIPAEVPPVLAPLPVVQEIQLREKLLQAQLGHARGIALPEAERRERLVAAVEAAASAEKVAFESKDPDRLIRAGLLRGRLLLALDNREHAEAVLEKLRENLEAIGGPPVHLATCYELLTDFAERVGRGEDAERWRGLAAAQRKLPPYGEPV